VSAAAASGGEASEVVVEDLERNPVLETRYIYGRLAFTAFQSLWWVASNWKDAKRPRKWKQKILPDDRIAPQHRRAARLHVGGGLGACGGRGLPEWLEMTFLSTMEMHRLCVSGWSTRVWQPSMPVSRIHDRSTSRGSTSLVPGGRSHLVATSTQGMRPLEQASRGLWYQQRPRAGGFRDAGGVCRRCSTIRGQS
jgi:hypothetical protein